MKSPHPKNWTQKTLTAQTQYVLSHVACFGGVQYILIEPAAQEALFQYARYRDPDRSPMRSDFTRLAERTLHAQTSYADALGILCAAVPPVYRDLGHQVTLSDQASVSWQAGELEDD